MNQKASKDKTEIEDALKDVETFQCSVCGQDKPLVHLQLDHVRGLKRGKDPINGQICFECWVLAWCKQYEFTEKIDGTGYARPQRFREHAPRGAKVIGFKDVIQTME
jgi:hypothetical protein